MIEKVEEYSSLGGSSMSGNFTSEEAIKRWDAFADQYAQNHGADGDLHKEVLLNPTLLELLGEVRGKKVLDAGCGEGYLSRKLAILGANVTAIDSSPRMLEIAKDRTPDHLPVKYAHGSCEDLHDFEDGCFDMIVSNMVIHDLANYDLAFTEMYRLLGHGGTFIFSILHPCFITPNSGWERSSTGEKLHWNVDRYFHEGAYEQPGLGDKEKMLFFHRTLTSYINTLLKTGFVLEGLVEPKPSEEMIRKYPSFKEDDRCADFIIFQVKK